MWRTAGEAMTTKEELRQIVETLNEEDAAELLDYAQWLLEQEDPLSDEELTRAERGLDQIRRGEYVTLDEVKRNLRL